MTTLLDKKYRGTGRTTRMLESAVAEATEGAYVFVAAANINHARLLYSWLVSRMHGQGTNLESAKVYFGAKGGSVTVIPIKDVDLQTGKTRFGAHPDCQMFVDHFAIESEMGFALDEWLRWSQP